MKNKVSLIIVILLMSIGFASISTTLIIQGNANVKENVSDFEIIFTKATLDNIDVYNDVISEDKKTITFTSNDLKKKGDTSTLNYEVTNNSRNYDAEVVINCNVKDGESTEYTSITNTLEDNKTIISAKESVNGTLTITLAKVSTNDVTEEYTCTLEFNAVERETLGVGQINLYNLIATQADKDTTIDFSVRSGAEGQETNGIYTTTNTSAGSEVYYYRGNVDNNLIYNNMCWKIIRTTETGGVKLIYNGTPSDGKCNNTGASSQVGTSAFNTNYNDNAYVGYMYGSTGVSTYKATHTNTNDSTIKIYIDNWFKNNFDDNAQEYLEDTVFCNDRNTQAYDANLIGSTHYSSHGNLGYGKNKTLYSVAFRANYFAKTPSPTLVCKNTNGTLSENNDSFTVNEKLGNGKLTYPVGLITSDEVVYAGFNTYYSNTSDYKDTNCYLYTGNDYWTLSPVVMNDSGYAIVDQITYSGNTYYYHSVYNKFGVRPVLSLKSGTKIYENGLGTEENPYVVV